LIAELSEPPIARGLAGPGMLADMIVRRWQDHMPLHCLALMTPRRRGTRALDDGTSSSPTWPSGSSRR
jgi:transposase